MDNVVLTRVAASLDGGLRHSVLETVREEANGRFRFVFVDDGRPRTMMVSLDSGAPWVGRPAAPAAGPRLTPRRFAAICSRRLRGVVVSRLAKPATDDRRVELAFADGQTLVAELSAPVAELVLLDADRRIVARARKGRSARGRLAAGEPYRARPVPRDRIDPFRSDAESVDDRLARRAREDGGSHADILRRTLLGIGRATADLIVRDSRSTGKSLGSVVAERLAAVERGELDPVIEAPWPPGEAVERGEFDPRRCCLLAWEPVAPAVGPLRRYRGADAAATAGLYHDAVERSAALARRGEGLQAILGDEIRRLREIRARVEADAAKFQGPEIWKRRGEALLAGLRGARRAGDTILVADPYDADGGLVAVPAEGGSSPAEAAQACFRRYRRFRRGLDGAARRAEQVAYRLGRLERLRDSAAARSGSVEIETLQHEMRSAGIPIAVGARTRASGATPARRPRVEGARIFRSVDGWTVLVGKSGKDNARLTFKLAGPEDFWFHVLGVAGAHVVVRNDERKERPPAATLLQAAAAAAWYSESRSQSRVDVQWTRRKYVRKIRGAAPGTVRVKKSETVRVRPALPRELEGGA